MTTSESKKRMHKKVGPDTGPPLAVPLIGWASVSLPAWLAFTSGKVALAAVLAIPSALMLGYWLWGRLLLVAALLAWRPRGIRGVLVTSDSPTWRPYVQSEWLPRLGDRVVVLNWSERSKWSAGLAVLGVR